MGQNSNPKKRSMYGFLMDVDKARRTKKFDEKPVIPAKKDAWYRNPGHHAHLSKGTNGACTHCGLQEEVHRGEHECYEEYLIRRGIR